MKADMEKADLERAWKWREERGVFQGTDAIRVFHGPGEGRGEVASLAVDRFTETRAGARLDHYWITRWDREEKSASPRAVAEVVEFLKGKEAASVVMLERPEKGVPEEPRVLHGSAPEGRFEVSEEGLRIWIQLLGARHPGLFLDHLPLRRWLRARARSWRALNTFSYTGSLSVALGLGGASHVTTLDLSKATVDWARENWLLNGLADSNGRFINGDVFEWLPRLKREGQVFECVILDPPSFSRGKKGMFSTSKDLKRLHELAFDLLASGGVLVTSINSANVSWSKYESDVGAAAREKKRGVEILHAFDLPETFPTRLGRPEDRYLKGWILRVT